MSKPNLPPYLSEVKAPKRLLGDSVFQIVAYGIFPDDEDPNQVRLLLNLRPHNGTRDHLETVPLSLFFSDRDSASAFLSHLAQEVQNQ